MNDISFLKIDTKEELCTIDLFRLLMAILVVTIHTKPFSFIHSIIIDKLMYVLTSVAVPYFFIASGYFLFRRWDEMNRDDLSQRLLKYLKRIIGLYIIWTIIYVPFTIYGFVINNMSLQQSISSFARGFLFVGENYYSWPLWYLLALIVSVFIIYIFIKLNLSITSICSISFAITTVGILMNYHLFFHLPTFIDKMIAVYFHLFLYTRNGIFFSLLFVVLGMLIAIRGIISSKLILYLFLFLGCIGYAYSIPFTIYIMGYSLFAISLASNNKAKRDLPYSDIRLMSKVIYFVHMIWVGLLSLWIFCDSVNSLILFILALALSFICAIFVIRFKNNRLMKCLFN
jgi:hypothetical protein